MRKKLLSLGILFGLLCIVTESWAWDSGAAFYAKQSDNTPSGSGDVYIYRGGPKDRLIKPTSWVPVETGASADITLSESDQGDGKIDDTHAALNMYFFAKPRTGYDFVGWYSKSNETGLMNGSTVHYDEIGNPTIWNNNNSDATPPGSGYWKEEGIYYLRYVQSVEKNKKSANLYAYAKFEVKPRDIILGGTGFDEVTYTATGFAGSVGKSTQTLSNASGNIELALTYDSENYTFEGWLWAEGGFTGGDTISKSASYTYPLATTYVANGMESSNKVHIWPVVKRKVVPVAEVTHNAVTTPYESWKEAIDAAKAPGVSGATITLHQDVDGIVLSQVIDRDMTLDLNGHTFAGTANYLFEVTGSGTDFTICNGIVSEGQISFSTSTVQYSYAIGVQRGSKLILQSGKVYANNTMSNGSSRGIEIQDGASLEMTGGSVEAQSLQQAYAIINRGAATISSGDLYAHTTTAATAVAYLNYGTTTEITGGTFRAYATTTTAYGIQQNVNNTMTITNATVRAEAVTSTAYSLARTNGVIVVNGGKYNAVAPSAVAATNVTNKAQITLQGGIYRTNTNLSSCCASGYGCYELNRGETWNEGYRYEVLPTSAARNFRVVADGTSSYFKEFSDVNTFINAGNFTFIEVYLIVPEYTIPAGNYTIPSVATLCVPYDFDCTIKTTDPGHPYAAPGTPSVYRKLILASGAHITNKGEMSVSATSQGGQPYGGCVYGKYGQIDMQSGSTITLKSGSNLYCWGYITGGGEITAESGSTIYEDFQITCWRGGTAGSSMVKNRQKVFPLAQYYIQNIEAKTIFHAGSSEYASTAVSISGESTATSAQIIGTTSGLFHISSGTLTKWYNAVDDRQMYQLEGDASIGSVRISVSVNIISVDIKSEEYVLPITNNMDITIKSGTLSCNNDVALLPGASITIDEGASVSLGSNCRWYVYDKAEWPNNGASAFNFPNASFTKVNYTPSTITKPRTYENMADARMNINGTLEVNKAIYTTAGGADICSTKGTGRVVLKAKAGTETETYQATQNGTSISYTAIPITSAKLHNDETLYPSPYNYTATAGAAAGTTIEYHHGHWGWVEVWKNGEDVLAAANTVSKVNNAEAKNSLIASIVAPEGYEIAAEKWETTVDNKNQEVIHSVKFVKIVTITWDLDNGSPNEVTYVKEGEKPTHETPEKPASVSEVFTFNKWLDGNGNYYTTDNLPAATIDATYKATYNASTRQYTVTWRNPDGTPLKSEQWGYGTQPNYSTTGETPTYSDGKKLYAFRGWKYERTGVEYGKDEQLARVAGDETYTALYDVVAVLIIEEDRTYSADVEVETTTVRVQGKLGVSAGKTFETEDLILEGSLDSSGQIENNGTINATNVYFDLSNGTEGFKARTWYAIAVPWQVDVPAYNQAGCGVYLTNDGVNYSQQNLGASFDLLYYDGAYRAQNGPSSKCWKLVEKDAAANHIIFPGRAYMIYLTSDAKTIRFKKKATADLFTNQTQVQLYVQQTGNDKDANWNGIANPATFHAYLNTASGNQGQIYIAGADRYEPIADMSAHPLVVGQPVFVQATNNKTVVAYATNDDYVNHAPRRMSSSNEEKILAEVRIAPLDKAYTDRLYVGAEEFKTDEYEIGKDLAKAGVSTKVAQMWVNRYNAQLCINSMELVNNRAEYPLTISAPAVGEYTIGMEPSAMAENQTYVLYLTLNGQPIWNLNYNAYTATLEKGTTEGYGLRLVYNAPEITTGIEETTILNGEQVRKVMIDEKVYIIRGGQVYSIDGQLVKY